MHGIVSVANRLSRVSFNPNDVDFTFNFKNIAVINRTARRNLLSALGRFRVAVSRELCSTSVSYSFVPSWRAKSRRSSPRRLFSLGSVPPSPPPLCLVRGSCVRETLSEEAFGPPTSSIEFM